MKRPLAIAAGVVATLATAGAGAGSTARVTGKDCILSGDGYRCNWLEHGLECAPGPWQTTERADGSRIITRHLSCTGTQTVVVGRMPE